MEKSFWNKEKHEIPINQLLAYIMAKIKPFEWVRIDMFHEENLFLYPPVFGWRYHNCDGKIYAEIFECIHSFKGNVEWTMYKVTRNYVIEPNQFHIIRLAEGNQNLERVLREGYKDFIEKAIEDVPMLCGYIEDRFDLSNKKPLIPAIPKFKDISKYLNDKL